jgi:acyl-CoA synthetase (NDP forming)
VTAPDVRTGLQRLLAPRSVAIVGLSADPQKHGARILDNLRRFGFTGDVWGVNPNGGTLHGIDTVTSIAAIPGAPDAVVFAIPGAAIPAALAECAEVGAGGGIVLGGGFAEAGADGVRLQAEVSALATRHSIRLLGPNSAGLIDAGNHTVLSFLTCLDRPADSLRPGPVGLVSQSGGSASYLHNLAGDAGSGFAVSVSTGNEADLGAGEALGLLLERDDVRAVAMLLETIRDGAAFMASCRRALALGKPVVVCKVGTSEAGAGIMQSHTGALASEWRRFAAVFDALGVTVTATPEQLFDVAELMARSHIPRTAGVGVVTHSGGTAVLLADAFDAENVPLPPPSDAMRAKLAPFLQLGAANNPTDLGGIITEPQRFAEVVRLFLDDEAFPMVVEVSTPHPVAHTEDRVAALLELSRASSTPLVHLWLGGDLHREGLRTLRDAGAPVTTHVESAVRAVGGLGRIAARRADQTPLATDASSGPDPAILTLIGGMTPAADGVLSEANSAALIAALGMPVARHAVARTAEEARSAADDMGYPVVVKVLSSAVSHKSEAGGVRLDVRDGDAVLAACRAIDEAWAAHAPGVPADGYLVEEFVPGLEVILGIAPDETFGPFVLVGLGGVLAEAIDDVALGHAPVSRERAIRMLGSLRGRRLLEGFRGSEPADQGALADLIVELSRVAASYGGVIADLDINPLVFSHGRWRAADAVVRLDLSGA